MDTPLVARFAEYLRAGATDPGPLAAALRTSGHAREAELLGQAGWTHAGDAGAGPGRRVFVGRLPPVDAAVGELWLDAVEMTPMVLVEEPARGTARPPERVWLATRPVARWQFRAFAAIAPLVGRQVQVVPALVPMDPRRLAGDDAAVMTDVTFGEACLYAWWFGKALATVNQWQGAERSLGSDAVAAMWIPGVREWGGYGYDDDERLRIDGVTWRSERDDPEDPDDIVVGAYDHRRDTGLRTTAEHPRLSSREIGNLPTMEPIALASRFPR